MSEKREFDLIIFGATGFTGFYVVRELLISINKRKEYSEIKWAIAGRNAVKLTTKLNELSEELNYDLSNITKIIADVSDPDTLFDMARRARLIINCVGPYYFYGRPVVNACVEAGTHHIDISGEPNYIESIAVDYYRQAVDKGLVIISTCGWDSIPCDLGVDIAKRQFDGRLHSVETFVKTIHGNHGYSINFGTLQSAIYGYKNMNQLRVVRRRLYSEVFQKKIPKSRIILKRKNFPFRCSEIGGWNIEFPGSDRSVVRRTQHYNYEHFDEPPIQIQTYYTVSSFTYLFGLIIFAIVFAIMTATNFGCRLLESYPEFFTAGVFSKKGPKRQQIESTQFQTYILGKGWSKRVISNNNDPNSEPDVDPDKTIMVKVSGADPGYIVTSTCLIQSGLTILLELDKMPKGVLTPASAFRNTQLVERLQDRNLKFEVISQ